MHVQVARILLIQDLIHSLEILNQVHHFWGQVILILDLDLKDKLYYSKY